MTVHIGQMTTYTNTEPNKRAVTDRLIMASPYDITSILALGLDNVGKFRFKNEPGTKYEWLEDQYPTRTDTSTADHFTDTTNTTSMIPTTPALYKAGDVIKVDSELIYVLSNTGVYLNLTRGFDGTTPVTHTTSSVVTIVYSARLEGATGTDDSPTHVVTTGVNYSTILFQFHFKF